MGKRHDHCNGRIRVSTLRYSETFAFVRTKYGRFDFFAVCPSRGELARERVYVLGMHGKVHGREKKRYEGRENISIHQLDRKNKNKTQGNCARAEGQVLLAKIRRYAKQAAVIMQEVIKSNVQCRPVRTSCNQFRVTMRAASIYRPSRRGRITDSPID